MYNCLHTTDISNFLSGAVSLKDSPSQIKEGYTSEEGKGKTKRDSVVIRVLVIE